jgi:hypothetical protein
MCASHPSHVGKCANRRILVQAGQAIKPDSISKIIKAKRAMAQVVERLPIKNEALSSYYQKGKK